MHSTVVPIADVLLKLYVFFAVQTCTLKPDIYKTEHQLDPKVDIADTCKDHMTGENVILDPITDKECNLKCNEGWFHPTFGESAPFKCFFEDERTSPSGVLKKPIKCASA